MSKSGQAFVAKTEGHAFTMYAMMKGHAFTMFAMMKMMGIPLTEEQAKFQAYLEKTYPAVADKPKTKVEK